MSTTTSLVNHIIFVLTSMAALAISLAVSVSAVVLCVKFVEHLAKIGETQPGLQMDKTADTSKDAPKQEDMWIVCLFLSILATCVGDVGFTMYFYQEFHSITRAALWTTATLVAADIGLAVPASIIILIFGKLGQMYGGTRKG